MKRARGMRTGCGVWWRICCDGSRAVLRILRRDASGAGAVPVSGLRTVRAVTKQTPQQRREREALRARRMREHCNYRFLRPHGWEDKRVTKSGMVIRRAISHHGSDCSLDCDGTGYCRGILVKRVDNLRTGRSVLIVFGDFVELGCIRPKILRSYVGRNLYYGGGFWEAVMFKSLSQP